MRVKLTCIVSAIVALMCLFAPTKTVAVDNCEGFSHANNPYGCCSHGNCPWWAYTQRPDLWPALPATSPSYFWDDAVALGITGSEPLVGSLAYFSNMAPPDGHIAYVLYVNSDGSFWVSEMGCDSWIGVRYSKYQSATGFIYGGLIPFRQTQTPQQLIDARKSNPLNDRNPYGWNQSPVTAFGTFSTSGWWFSFINDNPYVYNSGDGTAKNSYLSLDNGGDCNAQECAGIVYDLLGGAQFAYMVGWEKWQIWEALTDNLSNVNKSCPTGDCYETDDCNSGQQRIGGPSSCLGMPITNSYQRYQGQDIWRQDFQKGYIQNGTICCYNNCSPGWASGEIWNNRYSYLFADAYDRNGAARDVGDALNRVHVLYGDILIQDFSNGADGDGMIMYDMANWAGNSCATNKAYWLYGAIKSRFDANGGVAHFGCAIVDRFYYAGKWCQDFKNSSNQFFRIYETGSPEWLQNNPCYGVTYSGSGGAPLQGVAFDFDGDGIADYWDRTSTGEFHLDYASDGLAEWDTTFNGYGGSNDDPAPADYDGDGRYDFAILRNSDGKWLIDYALDGFGQWNSTGLAGYGGVADFPCPGDYDGDGVDDISVRDADGDWHIDYFAQGNGFGAWDVTYYGYGGIYDRPAPADYNGDGKCDFAILRNSDRKFLIDYAHNGFGSWDVTNLGGYGGFADYPCPADYDNDGQKDIAILWTSDRTWRVDRASNGFTGWDYILGGRGGTGDRPMPADFDGDGWDDVATYYAAYDQICLDYASNNYGPWDWCDDGPLHPTWKVASQEEPATLPLTFHVSQNYPNPFNPVTSIAFTLPTATHVSLEIFNILGQRVEVLVNADLPAGNHTSVWEADKQASGIYFYRLRTEDADVTKKMLLLK